MKNILLRIYHSKYFPRVFYTKPDGGKDSGVTAYFLIEWKVVFSIGILHFKKGSREAYHNHAFNAITWWVSGMVSEQKYEVINDKVFKPSFIPKYTSRNNCHKVFAFKDTWALTFRGNWIDFWFEIKNGKKTLLTHGRKKVL